MKPREELLSLADADPLIHRRLCICPEAIAMWRDKPRTLPDGRTVIDPGWEPSQGFMAAALAILRRTA